MDLDVLNISPESSWPKQLQEDFQHLKVLHARMMQRVEDFTNGFADFNTFVNVYARFVCDDSKIMLHELCKRSPAYDEEKVNKGWDFFSKDNKLKSNRKLVQLLQAYDIDTTNPDKAAAITEASELAAYLKPGMDAKFVLEHGFAPYINNGSTGYWFRSGEKSLAKISNFIMDPLMHVYSKQDNKRIISIDNGLKRVVLDMPSRSLISLEQFKAVCYEEGNYMFWGSATQLMKILNTINNNFPVCWELKTLGWQSEGFFAWSNAVYEPHNEDPEMFNDLGIATINDSHYFSPSASDIYKHQRAEDDEYENDRFLSYRKPTVTLEEWARLMCEVYPDHGMYGIGYVFIGLFRDLIYKIDNNCPHLSCYGEKGSGKSKFAESVSAVFVNDLQPFNLNHGTDFAFFNRLSRFRNCVTWFDEFDDQAIKEDRFQSIKGAYDGAGRERGKGTNKNRTEIARINSALLLTGQYLSTRDDNAALTRCIILAFAPDDNRTPDRIQSYDQLKKIEKSGISGLLVPLLRYRPKFEKDYAKSFAETFKDLRAAITDAGGVYKERVLRNYTAMLNCYRFFMDYFKFPFTYQDVFERCKMDVIRLSTLISESDSLADFWNTVLFLLEVGEIYEGFHFKVQTIHSVTVKTATGTVDKKFPEAKKLLFIRLTTIHKLYLEAHRKQTGKNGINLQSLELYIGSARGFIGKSASQRFTDRDGNSMVTTSFVFDYEGLNMPLQRDAPEADVELLEVSGIMEGHIEHVKVAGIPMLKYYLVSHQLHNHGEKAFRETIRTTCHDPQLQHEAILLEKQMVRATGKLTITMFPGRDGHKQTKRHLDVKSIELESNQIDAFKPLDVPSF